jgi:hypothetical protein
VVYNYALTRCWQAQHLVFILNQLFLIQQLRHYVERLTMFNQYYVFVPASLEHESMQDSTQLTVAELERRRLVAEAQANLPECTTLNSDAANLKKCA